MFHKQHIRKKIIFVRFFSILRTGYLFLLLGLPGKNAKFMLKMIFEEDTSLILHPLLYYANIYLLAYLEYLVKVT